MNNKTREMSNLTYMLGMSVMFVIIVVCGMFTAKNIVKIVDAHTTKPVSVVERIEEDDPRWNCEEMGNKICGPTYDA